MSCELEVVDRFGTIVRLDHSNWEKHKTRHPEVIEYHAQLTVAVSDPDVVMEDADTGAYHFYRLGLTHGKHSRNYLKVVVEYYEGGTIGKMKSWWLPRSIDVEGSLVWMRTSGR